MRLTAGIYESTFGDVRMTITDVTAHSGRLDAWVEVHAGKRRLTFGDYNLRGARTVSTLARSCEQAAPTMSMAWLEWLGESVYEAIHDTLEGTPAEPLSPEDASPPGWIVRNLIGDDQASSIVGYGEAGKSLLGLAAACTVASDDDTWLGLEPVVAGPVLMVDYEATRGPHNWRLSQLCRGTRRPNPKHLIWHRHESLPLARIITSVLKDAHRVGAKLVVVDSVMLARGISDTFGHEGTVGLYAALARLEIPCLLIDHLSKGSKENSSRSPWGSVINFNSLRILWSCEPEPRPGGMDLRLHREKANYHGALDDHAWQVRFTDYNRSATFLPVEPATVIAGGKATVADRVLGALRRAGPEGMSVRALAFEVGVAENSIRARLTTLKKSGQADQIGGVWLADDRQEEAPF